MKKKHKSFLQNEVLKTSLKSVRPLNKGGTSENYMLLSDKQEWLLKVLEKKQKERAERLVEIYQNLEKIKGLNTPHVLEFREFDEKYLILMNFIEGEKLKPSKITDNVLQKLKENYQALMSADFSNKDFVRPLLKPADYEKDIKKEIKKMSNQNAFEKFLVGKVARYFEKISQTLPKQSKKNQMVIHGDTGPNNFIIGRDGKVYFLDFEMIRFGFLSEDLAQLVLSLVLQHSIWFFNEKLLLKMVRFFNDAFKLSYQDWVYGTDIYFLRLIARRLRSGKFLSSPRKVWLFLKHLQKHEKVLKAIQKLY